MQVSKWGNSLAVRLPKALVEELGLEPGDEIDIISVKNRRIAIKKNDRRERAVARMKARNWQLPDGFRFDRGEANER
ncbi:MAG: AbrB/MazE/SpoVT family DNA-binding domain-containing protein [Beijerinckiaceae bacterium]|nr:AbrB/MazE/SpoVT family DNA-binding domain-containing protein [Beijerinckiaceae bacterium]MCI0735747.1 AbrB/MazE/SpoVT family DNA-binding domain-containing protein [Beijerinckiaceae bacterium]